MIENEFNFTLILLLLLPIIGFFIWYTYKLLLRFVLKTSISGVIVAVSFFTFLITLGPKPVNALGYGTDVIWGLPYIYWWENGDVGGHNLLNNLDMLNYKFLAMDFGIGLGVSIGLSFTIILLRKWIRKNEKS